ncbi:mycothiol synthase [Actinoallomurus sp. CA-150999]|uniref:mycothiol synthase n=1 Tax=Actinoallomurus sp. CA-150999 TaxID=3239887 RepID=UPI003D947FAC
MVDVMARELLTDDEVRAALAVVEAAAEADGVRPLGESSLLRLRDGGGAVLARDGEELAGVGVLDGDAAEFVVHPAFRRRGHGRALATALLERAGSLRVWAHGELPSAVALAGSLGFVRFRALWTMRRPLDTPLPEVTWPDGVRLRTFDVGADEDAWVRVNALAFADHPEQGAWTRADLERREREPWFSPEGFFLAERDGELIGFHWTKVHEGGVGEVYVVGVDPAAQGLGLGRALTLAGLHHLKALGLPTVMLYADESNTPATSLYERLGFEHFATDAMYRSPAPAPRTNAATDVDRF